MKTKSQIKFNRLFTVGFLSFGLLLTGYFVGKSNLSYAIVFFIVAIFGAFSTDKLNNDLEYGRYK